MKNYVVYFAKNDEFHQSQEFEFEYSVEALSEEEAKQKAVTLFNSNNPELKLEEFTYGFSKN